MALTVAVPPVAGVNVVVAAPFAVVPVNGRTWPILPGEMPNITGCRQGRAWFRVVIIPSESYSRFAWIADVCTVVMDDGLAVILSTSQGRTIRPRSQTLRGRCLYPPVVRGDQRRGNAGSCRECSGVAGILPIGLGRPPETTLQSVH